MLINRKSPIPQPIEEKSVQVAPMSLPARLTISAAWPTVAVGIGFCALWLAMVLEVATALPLHAASWLTFAGLLIAPGYLLGDILVRRLDLDWLERLALAFPVGTAVLSIPGMAALLLHWRVDDLAQAWIWISFAVVAGWALSWLRIKPRLVSNASGNAAGSWTWDERLLLLLIVAGCVLITPVLNQHKIDGDTLAVGSFTADAMAGLPLNQVEPLFGTELGPGVRMAFNQSLPMIYLWSHFSHIDPMTLMGSATRAMFAFWSLLATYLLARNAGVGVGGSLNGRRIGLFAVAIQLLIYMTAPFLRGDNVSLFFFERIAADKFLVPVTMLPVAFGLAIRYVRLGEWQIWAAAALVAFSVSAIHPLVAAMLALGLGAFGGLHLLMRLRHTPAYRRVAALAGLVVIVMILPLTQLALSRGEDPLAPSYPSTFEGWEVSYRMVPVLPYVYLPTLDVHGPLPDLSQIRAEEALTATDPFLVWRFAVNMERRRLVLFDLDRYISDPNILLEPPYLLALLLLPLLLRGVRRSLGAQFVIATTAAIFFVMYNPLVTPLLGGLVMPWILWRFVWMFPYALIIALALAQLLHWLATHLATLNPDNRNVYKTLLQARRLQRYAPLVFVILLGIATGPAAIRNLQTLSERAGFPYFFPQPEPLLKRLDLETTTHGPATVMADADLSVSIPAFVANAHIVAHRIPTTSEVFPAHGQTEALQRLIDQDAFYRARYLTTEAAAILQRYDARYVIASGGSNLDIQLRLLPHWFTPLFADQSYVLYAVDPVSTAQITTAGLIQANSALAQREWSEAELLFRAELGRNRAPVAAWAGLAEIAHARGEFGEAVGYLERGLAATLATSTQAGDETANGQLAALYFRLGQIYGDMGRLTDSVDAFATAAGYAPAVARFHVAWGDACLRVGQMSCAEDAFQSAVAQQNLPDEASYTVVLADLWRQRGYLNRAIPLYELSAGRQSVNAACLLCGFGNTLGSRLHQLILIGAYQEAGRYAEADALLEILRSQEPYSPDLWSMTANLHVAQGQWREGVDAYHRAIRLLDITGQDSTPTRLALAGALLQPGTNWTGQGVGTTEAQAQLNWVAQMNPSNATVHSLQGELHSRLFRSQDALAAYENAFRLDPTSVPVYFALSNQYRRLGGAQTDVPELLQAALRANPNEATLALALGDQRQRRGEMGEAVEAYLIALNLFEQRSATGRLNPRITGGSRAYAYVQLAAVHEELGEAERAMNFYGAAVAGAPDTAWVQVAYGNALRRQNQTLQAELAYRHALRADPHFIPGYLALADLQTALGAIDQGAALRNQALEIAFTQLTQGAGFVAGASALTSATPDLIGLSFSSDVFDRGIFGSTVASGEAGIYGTQTNASVEAALAALLADDVGLDVEGGSTVLNLLGRLASTPQQVDVIFELYRQALAQGEREGWYPTAMAHYYKGMGDLYLTRNRPEAAAGAYRQAIALDEGWLQARLGLVNALSSAGENDAAIDALEALFVTEPGVPQVRLGLAQQYAQIGRTDYARTLLSQTIAATPGNVQVQIALAQLLQEQGDLAAAEDIFQRAIALAPGAVEARTAYASLLLDQMREEEAASVLKAAHEVERTNVSVHLLSSMLAQRQGDSQAAAEWLARAAQLPDPSGANLIAIADLYGRFAFNQEGLRFVEAATARYPEQVELVLRQARTQRSLGQYNEALATLLAAAHLDLNDARLTGELAEVYLAQGRLENGIITYRQAMMLDPSQELYVMRLAELYLTQGDTIQAEHVLRQGLGRVTQPAALYTALSELYLRLGRTDEAHALLTDGLTTLGDEPTLIVGMGVLLEAQALRSLGPSDSAERWYQDALARMGDQPDMHAALADHYLRRGYAARAVPHYEAALALVPARARYYLGLGAAQAAASNRAGAEEALLRAIRLEPGLLDAYYQLVDLYSAQREWDKARSIYIQAKQVAPFNGEVHVRYAAFLLARGETQLGMDLLQKAPAIAPNARTLVARAGVYAKLRRTDDAIIDLQQAIAYEPGNVDAYIALGDVLRDFGNQQAATAAYSNAIRLNPGLGLARLRVTRGR